MEFFSAINSIGTIPALILILVIFILLYKEVKKDNIGIAKELKSHEDAISQKLKEYQETVDKQISMQNSLLEKLEDRLRAVETDYAEKTYVQECNSGWRTELRRVDEKLDRILLK